MSKIKKALDRLKYKGSKIVYVGEECCIKSREHSRSKSDYYFYEYTKPNLILTSDHRSIAAEEILESRGNCEMTVRGLRGEAKIISSWDGEKSIEYTLYISKEACPLRIKYTYGSGEGYSDSDYWSSEYHEYWVSYL